MRPPLVTRAAMGYTAGSHSRGGVPRGKMLARGVLIMTSWRLILAACVIVFAAYAPRADAADEPKPGKPDTIFDDTGDSATPKPKAPKPPEPKPETEPKKSSPTETTEPPATEAPQQRPPAPPPVPAKPAAPLPAKPAAPTRAPVPAQAAQDKALKLVKDVFADDYRKKTPADRVALAERLIEQAGDAGNDATTKYVMLREARDLAVGAGDVATAMSAVDAMSEAFVVNPVDLKTELLTAAAKKPADAAAAAAVADGFAELADQALADADVDRANKMIAQAETVAKKAKDSDLSANMSRRKKEFREFVSAFGALGPMKEKLKKSPDDPAANLALGKFYCFAAGNWDQGLPMLAKGSDQALQKLARADLAAPENPQAQATLGDGWFDLSEKPNAAGKLQLRARAGHWYEKAVNSLSGLEKARVEKRVASIGSDEASGTSAGSATPEEKGIRMLEAVVAKIPAEARPKVGKAM